MRLADNFWELKELLNKTAIDYNIDVRVDEITADQLNQFFSALSVSYTHLTLPTN